MRNLIRESGNHTNNIITGGNSMYNISTEKDKPDIGYMEAKVDQLMRRGIRLADCAKLSKYYTDLREALKTDFITKYGIQNPNSSVQLTRYLEALSNQVDLKSKNDIINICFDDEKGKWTSNGDAMEKLADLGYEFAQDLLDYRHAKKYAESIESFVSAQDADGLVHPEVSLGKTNRINYSKPGLMTIPKKLLWHMIAPYKAGNKLYSVDIKNQEPGILINMTGANELKYALESPDGLYETMFKQCFEPTAVANVLIDTFMEDRVYSINEIKAIGTISPATYSPVKPMINNLYYNNKKVLGIETICMGSSKGVYPKLPETVDIELEDGSIVPVGVEWESADKKYKKDNDYSLVGRLNGLEIRISKAERNEFKRSYLALSYGASAFGIKNMCKTIDGGRVYKYITGIASIKNYRSTIDKVARQGINCINTVFGNRLYAGDGLDYKRLKRVLLDLPIQGTGADILSLLIKRFYDYTADKGISDYFELYYTRHDELIIEVDKGFIETNGDAKVKEILADMLEHQVDDWTPFKIEIEQTEAQEIGVSFEDE